MVQVLAPAERRKGFGERFAQAFSNVGQALPGALTEYNKAAVAKRSAITKNLTGLRPFISKELKSMGRESLSKDPDYLKTIHDEAASLIEQGMGLKEAFETAYGAAEGDFGESEKEPSSKNMAESLLGSFIKPMKSPIPTQFGSVAEDPLLNLIRKHPGKSAGLTALGAVAPIEELVRGGPSEAAMETAKKLGFTYPEFEKHPDLLSAKARRKLLEGVGEREARAASQLELLGSLLPAERLIGAARWFKGKKALPSAEKGILGTAKEVVPESASLAGRVSKQPITATEMRVSRTAPEKRIFPRTERIKIREEQVKNFPKYVQEIEADAVKRAQQAAAREPKTVKGKESRQIRIHEAEKRFPVAQEDYYKSASRLRALEDQYASLNQLQKKEMGPLLDMARKDLQEAELSLKQAAENLKGINYRASAQEMKQSARNKMLELKDSISEGAEYNLAKADYSPELIKRAKEISKKKPLPHTPKEDFYTQVHDMYANEYRNRLGQIEGEMAKLNEQKGLASLYQRQNLAKERDLLRKMVESAEAEAIIHKHNFGLRQMSERHKAKERMAHFKKIQESPKVKQSAQEKMWKERIKESYKNPEERAKVIDEAVEEIAAKEKSPETAKKIHTEKESLKESVNVAEKEGESLGETLKKVKESEESLGKKSKSAYESFKKFGEKIDNLLKKVPVLGSSPIGRNVIIGVVSGMYDAINQEYKILPFATAGQVLAPFIGRGGLIGGGIRGFASRATKEWAEDQFKEDKIRQAEKAYRRHDDKALLKYSPKVKKEARQRAFG